MSNRTLGFAMVAIGLLMVVVGVVSLGGDAEDEVAAATTVTIAPTTTTAAPATTTSAPPPSTTVAPTTTTPSTTTTTTTVPPPSIEDFVVAYADATETGDADFLSDRLLPDLHDIFGNELCRKWVETEIVALGDYQLTGDVRGPFSRTLNVGDTSISVEQYYEAPVSFTFQGASFDAVATFVIRDGLVYWIGECR